MSGDFDTSTLHARIEELEAALRDCQQHAAPFSEVPAPFLLLDPHGTVVDANAAACTLLGRARTAVVRHRLPTFLTASTQGSLTRLCTEAAASGTTRQGELQVLTGDGRTVDVLAALSAVGAGNRPQGYRVVFTDVTVYKQAYRSLLDQEATHDRRVHGQSVQARALKSELTQVVLTFIEQLNLPLGRAHTFLVTARQGLETPPDEVEYALQHADLSLHEVRTLIASVSGYLQVRNSRTVLQPVKLAEVLRQVLTGVAPVMAERDVRFTHDPLPTFTGDSRSLKLILEELLGNALKYTRTRATAHIHLYVRDHPADYVIGLEDNGVGFNMRYKDKLFQLFGRLHASADFEGTGIGLLSVRWAVERVGGRVWAEGRPDHGATIWFAWPKFPQERTPG